MGILNAFQIGCDGLRVHSKRVEIAAKNIANIDTPNYKRKIPVISSNEGQSFSSVLSSMGMSGTSSTTGGVNYDGIIEDPTPGAKIYQPGHPDADKYGYIRLSNTNAMADYADATLAQRAYEASLGVLSISKSMASNALEIGR